MPDGPVLVRLRDLDPRWRIELRYATPDNFTGRILYPSAEAWLRPATAQKLRLAQDHLDARHIALKVLDAYRPPSAQQALWTAVPDERFVAPPGRGSRHTRGTAVDVTLVDGTGAELEMPSGFDEFTERAQRDWSGASVTARRHLDWLTEAMTAAGFTGIRSEWWHYDDSEWRAYDLLAVEVPVDAPQTD